MSVVLSLGYTISVEFEKIYQNLNTAQKEAVDTFEGPVLVIAGPGTGKTQLLGARVAKILKETDTLPENILCLTFTESGAANMRERLTKFIGQAAYSVNIGTYHSLGGDLIRRYPEYFGETRLQQPVDELGAHQIISEIVAKMSYQNPLKHTQYHIRDLISTISDIKKELIKPGDLRELSQQNLTFLAEANQEIIRIFQKVKRLPGKLDGARPLFEQTLEALQQAAPVSTLKSSLQPLVEVAANSLEDALLEADSAQSSKPLTNWKNAWLIKNADNQLILCGERESESIASLAEVLEAYQEELASRGLYDFNDMILRSIEALQQNDELKFTLQEKYQYILLDEFQDTNASQLEIVKLLTDNPVHEGRPNVLAVGDDDQAIYAFQGARYSNMLDFHNLYREVKIVNLTENYRSHAHILHTAHQIAEQVNDRLHHKLDNMSKTLKPSNSSIPEAIITRSEYSSQDAEYSHIAENIAALIQNGTSPSQIAVLAPKHRYLEPLVPYLNSYGVPVSYEKRENILESPIIHQLLTMSKLVLAIHEANEPAANQLWPEVLSYEFWGFDIAEIWKISWRMNDQKEKRWSEILLESEIFNKTALLLLSVATKVETSSLEEILDILCGTTPITNNETTMHSPLREYYIEKNKEQNPDALFDAISQLSVLREKLREHQNTHSEVLLLRDFITLTQLYQEANIPILNTSPYNQADDAIQIMTTFKAKGLEFEHVFLPQLHENVWGGSSRGNSNRITLPKNVEHIRSAATTEDERLRIFFVAITRAKHGLHLSSHTKTLTGKSVARLKYLDEYENDDQLYSRILPENTVITRQQISQIKNIESAQRSWHTPHLEGIEDPRLRALLQERLKRYQISPTHLNSFIDLEYGGPEKFFFNTLLRFPKAPLIDGQYGNAIHETLEWYQHQIEKNTRPSEPDILARFKKQLETKYLLAHDFTLLLERGEQAITAYIAARGHIFTAKHKAEYNFKNEGVFVEEAHLTGKVDYLEINKNAKTITVVDYKTGKPYQKWENNLKLHKYKQQLYCYKLLVEGSSAFNGYTVTAGRLEFIEPDRTGNIHTLELEFDETMLERTKKLLRAMWSSVHTLSLPETSAYNATLADIKKFEDSLIEDM
jgi:DNA helicase-2/ATP-dependent DNA helicase PcrA